VSGNVFIFKELRNFLNINTLRIIYITINSTIYINILWSSCMGSGYKNILESFNTLQIILILVSDTKTGPCIQQPTTASLPDSNGFSTYTAYWVAAVVPLLIHIMLWTTGETAARFMTVRGHFSCRRL